MITVNEAVYQKPLSEGLTLRTLSNLTELDRVAAINEAIHEPGVGEMTRKIFEKHPDTTGRDLVFIENEQGEAVASLCLIPWTLRFGPVELPVAELGIVGTLEHYRGKGLNRVMMAYFWQRYQERGALLSIIQGIPFFYRQYGYEYAMLPLEGGWRIQMDQIPAAGGPEYSFRPAVPADIPQLGRLYDQQNRLLDLSSHRSPEVWSFLLERTRVDEAMQHDTWIMEDASGAAVGYCRIPDYHFNQNLLTIDELSLVDFYSGLSVLNFIKKLANERGKDGLRLHLPHAHPLVQLARSFGAVDLGHYSWQIRIPDRVEFLRRITPVFEQRLSGSMFAGLSGKFGLNLYQEVIGLTFSSGRLTVVAPCKEDEQTILNLPPNQFVPLVLGGHNIEEIHTCFPDAYARGPWQLLVDTLFPKTNAFFHTIY